MRLTVRVPASTANLGSGFDCVGLAVDWFDELTLEVSRTGGLQIEVFGEGSHQVPRNESHLVIATLLHTLRQWGVAPPGGLLLRTRNTIPHSRGLGSSAAAIVAGCALAHGIAFPDEELDRAELTRVSSLLEGHPDNAGAAVWGGAILAWPDGERVELIRLRLVEGLRCLAFVPDLEVRTEGSRSVVVRNQGPFASVPESRVDAGLLVVAAAIAACRSSCDHFRGGADRVCDRSGGPAGESGLP